jgi:hypothetical protein
MALGGVYEAMGAASEAAAAYAAADGVRCFPAPSSR